jgi:membrane fusion protein, multidrug efflux system
VVFTIAEDSLPDVLQRARGGTGLEVDAYDRDLTRKIATGKLLTVDNQIDQTTGTVKLKAEFANKNAALFPNQLVNARLRVDTLRNVVIVPSAAIQHSPRSTFVYVVKDDETVETRDVTVRLTDGDETAVASGMTASDVVVTDGVDKLQPGTKVGVQTPHAPGDSEGKKAAAQ